nr:hypothetical protein [Tanacetum cinerariifolium]
MDLFAFIHHTDPTKDAGVHVVNEEGGNDAVVDQTKKSGYVVKYERANIVADDEIQATIANKPKGERKKRMAASRGSGSSLPPKKLRADHGTSGAGASTGEKFVAALQGLLERSTLPVEVGVAAVATLLFVNSFVTLMPEREEGGHTNFVTRLNLRTQHPSERFVVLSNSPCHSSSNALDAEVSFVVGSLVSDPSIMTVDVATSVVADTSFVLVPRAGYEKVHQVVFVDSTFMAEADLDVSETLHQVYVPKWNVTNDSSLDDPDVRLRLEHKLKGRRKFEGKCAMQADLLKEKDAKIASLKERLSLKEVEVVEAIHLHGQVFTVEATEAARVAELNSLKEQTTTLEGQVMALESAARSCEELIIKDASLESEKDKLTDQVYVLETTCSGLYDQVLGYELFKEQIKMSSDYLSALGGAIGRATDKGMHDGLVTSIEHGKAGRGLVDVAANNLFAETNYVFTVNVLRFVDFPLLAQLESQRARLLS